MSLKSENRSLYSRWVNMLHRCNNPAFHNYSLYGGRGIKICDEWAVSFESFYNWCIESGYKDGLQIDRINNNEGYYPENCRWATVKENTRNRNVSVFIEYNGQRKTVAEWAEIVDISYDTLFRRVKNTNWTPEKILNTGINKGRIKRGSYSKN